MSLFTWLFGPRKLTRKKVLARLAGVHVFSDSEAPQFRNTDLSELNLSGLEFDHREFHEAILVETKLRDCTFSHCTFERADLARVDLSGATIEFCHFTDADLSGARLTGAHFLFCDFTGAELGGIETEGASFESCTNIVGPSPEQRYRAFGDFEDESRAMDYAERQLQSLRELVGGRILQPNLEREIFLSVKTEELTYRVGVDLNWGSVKIQARGGMGAGDLTLHRSVEAKPTGGEPDEDWEDLDPCEQRRFVGQGVYLEGSRVELDLAESQLAYLGHTAARIPSLMNQVRMEELSIEDDRVELSFERDVLQMDLAATVQACIPFLAELAAQVRVHSSLMAGLTAAHDKRMGIVRL